MNELLYYDLKEGNGVAPSLAIQVCRELGRRIVGGHIREHELIEDENRLASRFGVSKSVVREAVKLLVGKGLLEVRRRSGTRVRRRASWAFLDDDVLAWHLSAEPKPKFLRQLMDIRRMMEPKAAAWAAQFGEDDAHAQVEAAQSRMERKMQSAEEFVIADAMFHRSILRSANNEILLSMEGVIFSALLTSIRLTNADPRKNERSLPFHRAVTDAVLSRDALLAERKMTLLLDDANDRLAKAIPGFGQGRDNACAFG